MSTAPRIRLLGIPIDAVSADQAVERLLYFLRSGRCHVMTPNNEMLVEAHRNRDFHDLLQRTALNLPDSTGLLLAARLTGQRLPERVTGADTVVRFCDRLDDHSPIFLLGGGPGVAEEAARVLQARNPRLRIAGTYAGSPRAEDTLEIVRRINASKPSILFVAYGAPQQDLWIDAHLPQLPTVHLAMGVGGTFDFLSGRISRAPRFFRRLGLEWLWRLFKQPSRWRRILRATIVFPWLVLREGKGK